MGASRAFAIFQIGMGASRAFAIFQIGIGLREHLQYFK
jgi:hypothetical protein